MYLICKSCKMKLIFFPHSFCNNHANFWLFLYMFLPENIVAGVFLETGYKKNVITARVLFKNILIYLGFFTVFILLYNSLSSISSVERLFISLANNYIFTPGLQNFGTMQYKLLLKFLL